MNVAMKMRRKYPLRTSSRLPVGTLVAVLGLMGFGCGALASPATDAGSQEQLAGVWRIERSISAVRTAEGKEPPLKPAAAAVYRQHIEARRRGDTSFDSSTWCASPGMPRIMWLDYPFEIMVSPRYVTFLHEWNWWARIVYLKDALDRPAGQPGVFGPPPGPGAFGPPPGAGPLGPPPGPEALSNETIPVAMGLSKGRWEGQVLVVQTSDFTDSTLLDSSGMPHSSQLKLTERFRLLGPDLLESRTRIEDPETFTKPWETVVTYRRQHGADIREDVCLDRIRAGAPAVEGE